MRYGLSPGELLPTRTRPVRTGLATIVALVVVLAIPAAAPAAPSPYLTAPFNERAHPFTFGQAPTFMPDGRVVYGRDEGQKIQTYIANLDGSGKRCLTCTMPGPNGVPAPRPQGDWILFHSWQGHSITLGSPGFGGLGSALWVIRPDGSQPTRLTGVDTDKGSGEGEDAYHAYWSPDGKRLVWAHLNWNFATDGGRGQWDIRVADFVNDAKGARLENTRIVRPANGHYYETQWWAHDGSGFLYTETVDSTMNTELFFCRLTADGCQVTQLTHDTAWDEQANFTPDGRSVIYMSTHDHPGFYNSFTNLTNAAGLTNEMDWLLTLPIFEVSFLQPVAQEATDLYILDLQTGARRRLTTAGDDGWITPEFTWDPTFAYLFWTELRYPDGARVPLPVDLVKQLQATAQFLSHPPTDIGPHGNELALLPLESRTRTARFDLAAATPPAAGTTSPASATASAITGPVPGATTGFTGARPAGTKCAGRHTLTLKPRRARGARVVRVEVRINGKRVLVRRGRSLGRVRLRRPAARVLRVLVISTQSTGRRLKARRTIVTCS